jgi:hypothetical protein
VFKITGYIIANKTATAHTIAPQIGQTHAVDVTIDRPEPRLSLVKTVLDIGQSGIQHQHHQWVCGQLQRTMQHL